MFCCDHREEWGACDANCTARLEEDPAAEEECKCGDKLCGECMRRY